MQIEKTQISENGRIVIPAAFRKAMGLKPGETVVMRMEEKKLYIQSQRQAIEQAQALVRKHISPGRRLSDELIAERRSEVKRELRRA